MRVKTARLINSLLTLYEKKATPKNSRLEFFPETNANSFLPHSHT